MLRYYICLDITFYEIDDTGFKGSFVILWTFIFYFAAFGYGSR